MPKNIDDYLPGQSPLPPSWKKGLLHPLSSYEELNEHEALNIPQVVQKYQFGSRKKWPVSDFQFLRRIHKEMYGDVWKWLESLLRLKESEVFGSIAYGLTL